MIRKAISLIICLGALFFVVFWFNQHGAVNNTKNIEFIKAHTYNGKMIDLQNEIGVSSSDDIIWYYDKHDTIVIEYGKISLKYNLSDFVKSDVQSALNDVFITVKQNKETLKFKIYYNGEEIPEYVKK